MADIVSAKESFSTDIRGVPVYVSSGDLYYADDELVTDRPSLFGEVTVKRTNIPSRDASPVGEETADASPGTRRKATRLPVVDTPRGPKSANASATTKTGDAVSTSHAAKTPVPEEKKPAATPPSERA